MADEPEAIHGVYIDTPAATEMAEWFVNIVRSSREVYGEGFFLTFRITNRKIFLEQTARYNPVMVASGVYQFAYEPEKKE